MCASYSLLDQWTCCIYLIRNEITQSSKRFKSTLTRVSGNLPLDVLTGMVAAHCIGCVNLDRPSEPLHRWLHAALCGMGRRFAVPFYPGLLSRLNRYGNREGLNVLSPTTGIVLRWLRLAGSLMLNGMLGIHAFWRTLIGDPGRHQYPAPEQHDTHLESCVAHANARKAGYPRLQNPKRTKWYPIDASSIRICSNAR